jgi:hypothetical protein
VDTTPAVWMGQIEVQCIHRGRGAIDLEPWISVQACVRDLRVRPVALARLQEQRA